MFETPDVGAQSQFPMALRNAFEIMSNAIRGVLRLKDTSDPYCSRRIRWRNTAQIKRFLSADCELTADVGCPSDRAAALVVFIVNGSPGQLGLRLLARVYRRYLEQ